MKKRPTILLSNDDGIHAPGLMSLWKALKAADIGDLIVIAPAEERSGMGVAITWTRPMQVRQVSHFEETPAWSVDGNPADCIKLGSTVILKKSPPDFIVSGINAGSNAGRNVLHSGTVGAVIEGVFRGIPGMAISCEDDKNPNYHVAEKSIGLLLEYLIEHPLPAGSFLNVNYPKIALDDVKGFKLARQGRGRWIENPSLHKETVQGPEYWLGGVHDGAIEDEDCDITYLKEGYMTAVPIHVYEMTDMHELRQRQVHFENFFLSKKD